MNAVDASLKRLQTDYIDLYQSHWTDENTRIEETLRAYDDLVKQGKVRYIGASNYAAWELMQALWVSDKNNFVRYDSIQPHYNLIYRAEFERELRAVCRAYEIGVIPYSPLAGGFLTGKYRKNAPFASQQTSRPRQARHDREKFCIVIRDGGNRPAAESVDRPGCIGVGPFGSGDHQPDHRCNLDRAIK